MLVNTDVIGWCWADFQNKFLMRSNNRLQYEFFVITMRDPLNRAISAYQAAHPIRKGWQLFLDSKSQNSYLFKFYSRYYPLGKEEMTKRIVSHKPRLKENIRMYTCFESLEEYAQLVGNHSSHFEEKSWRTYHEENNCAGVAKSTLHHMDIMPMTHNYWDLRQILDQVKSNLKDKTFFALRQEYLWQDWTSTNRWLGDEGEILQGATRRNATEMAAPINMELSEGGRKNLCLALRDEYRIYLRLLVLSVNLSEKEVNDSLLIGRKNCPWLNLELPMVDTTETYILRQSQSWTF